MYTHICKSTGVSFCVLRSDEMPADYKYLTIEDLIEMLQVTRSTIYNLKKKGLPFIKIGSNVRFEQSEVIDWLKNNHKKEIETDKQA